MSIFCLEAIIIKLLSKIDLLLNGKLSSNYKCVQLGMLNLMLAGDDGNKLLGWQLPTADFGDERFVKFPGFFNIQRELQ